MWSSLVKFELNYHLRQPLPYTVSAIFVFLTLLSFLIPDRVSIGGGADNLNHNAHYVIFQLLSTFGFLSIIPVVALSASAALRDFDYKMSELIFATPIDKNSLFYARFSAVVMTSIFIFFPVFLATLIMPELGLALGTVEPEKISAFSIQPYLYSLLLAVIPNLIIMAVTAYATAIVSRNVFLTYACIVLFILLNILAGAIGDLELLTLSALIDPLGGVAFDLETRYWTVFEKNNQNLPITGLLIANRLLWLGFAGALLIWAVRYAKLELRADKPKKKSTKKDAHPVIEPVFIKPAIHLSLNGINTFKQYLSQTKLEVMSIVKNVGFLVMLSFGVLNVFGFILLGLEGIYGTKVYLTTGAIINFLFQGFNLFFLIILVYYGAELVHRERTHKINEVMDAFPHASGIMVSAKYSALLLALLIIFIVLSMTGILIQLGAGITDLQLALYGKSILVYSLLFILIAALAVFIPSVIANKYLAMFGVVLIFFFSLFADGFGIQHFLLRFGIPGVQWSDMNGYGHNLIPRLWFFGYWLLFCLMLLILAHLFWPRGTAMQARQRIKAAKERLTPLTRLSLAGVFIMFISCGGFIYYNTNIINTFISDRQLESVQAEYEKTYKQYQEKRFPSVTDVMVAVDIYPQQRDIKIAGRYQLKNTTDQPIKEIHLSFVPYLVINQLTVKNGALQQENKNLGYYIYEFNEPLLPGEDSELSFDLAWINDGFKNHGATDSVLYNGTFLDSFDVIPTIGYNSGFQLTDNSARKREGLGPVEREKPLVADKQYDQVAFGVDVVNLDITLSTSNDQIAVAPGELVEQWVKDERRYFRYKTSRPIWNFYAMMSARFALIKDQWQGIPIEIYYHPGHEYNTQVMVKGIKDSLSYFSQAFSPYQYPNIRILEFPGYRRFAQSFATTIPFSETIGFTADLTNSEDIDYVYYVTAHEVAHQWWGHQLAPALAQGSTMIVESLSQYAALMVMEKTFGQEKMQRFLRYELDRYLSGRGGEQVDETPLYKVEGQQYIRYQKGSLVMYALKDYIGEDKVNEALSEFIDQYAFKGAPYPTTYDLLKLIRSKTPDHLQDMVTDLFEKIVLYDFSITQVESLALEDGRFETQLTILAKKYQADGDGKEKEVPIEGWFDVALLGEKNTDTQLPEVIYMKKHLINSNKVNLSIISDKKPIKVGIDPYNKMIDRNPSNNIKSL